MTFNPHSTISMLQTVFSKLPDVLPVNFFNIDWGQRGVVILVMVWDKIMQFFLWFQGILARTVVQIQYNLAQNEEFTKSCTK